MDAASEDTEGVPKELHGLFAVLFLEIWGAAMTIPVFQYFCIVQLGLKATHVGIVMAAFNGAQLLGAPLMGRVSDAVGRRLALLACFTWTALCFLATACVGSFLELLAVRAVAGLSGGSIPITQAMVMDVTLPERRPKVLGAMGGLLGLAFTLGPVVAVVALSLARLDRRWIFVAASGLALLGCLLGAFVLQETLPEERRRPLSAAAPGLGSLAREMRGVWSPAMCCIWLGRFCASFALLCLFATYAFLIRDAFGWGDMEFGLILASSGITAACAQFLLYPRASAVLGKHAVFVVGSICVAAYFVCLPMVTIGNRYVVVHLMIKVGFCIGSAFMDAGIPDLVGFHAREDRMGFAQGLTTAFRSFASVLAPLLAGALYDRSPYIVYFVAAALAGIGGLAVACAPLLPTSRELGETTKLLGR